MIRTLVLAAALAGASVPALAKDVTIVITGKDTSTIKTEIAVAARSVCRDLLTPSTDFYSMGACIDLVTADAMAKLERARPN